MKFFDVQDNMDQRTFWTVLFFLGIVSFFSIALGVLLSFALFNSITMNSFSVGLTLTLFCIMVGMAVRNYFHLNSSPNALMRELGAVSLPKANLSLPLQQYQNVATEMSLAAGIATPMLYVIQADAINACAYSSSSYHRGAIAVTTGAIARLTREELAGVVAHEIGHLVSGDSKRNLLMLSCIQALDSVHHFGEWIGDDNGGFFSLRGRNRFIMMISIICIIVGYVGMLCGKLLQCMVSRQREHHCDAQASQYTRNPQALATALAKIKGFGSHVDTGNEAFGFLMFDNHGSFFATHPPINDRMLELVGKELAALRAPILHDVVMPGSLSETALRASSNTNASTMQLSSLAEESKPVNVTPTRAESVVLDSSFIADVLRKDSMACVLYTYAFTEHVCGLSLIERIDKSNKAKYKGFIQEISKANPEQQFAWINIATRSLFPQYSPENTHLKQLVDAVLEDEKVSFTEMTILMLLYRKQKNDPWAEVHITKAMDQWITTGVLAVDRRDYASFFSGFSLMPVSAKKALLSTLEHLENPALKRASQMIMSA